ncbi:protein of unknown function [Paraburkholderia kururiensis]
MSGVAATPEDVNNLDHSSRVNNAIKYRSPTFSGWTGEALYALGGVAGSFTQQGSLGLGIRNVPPRQPGCVLRSPEAHGTVCARGLSACKRHDARCLRERDCRDRLGRRCGEWPVIAVRGRRAARRLCALE